MISVIGCDLAEEDVWEELKVQAHIMVAEFVHGKPYTCLTLTPSKGKKVAKFEKEAYLFNISNRGVSRSSQPDEPDKSEPNRLNWSGSVWFNESIELDPI